MEFNTILYFYIVLLVFLEISVILFRIADSKYYRCTVEEMITKRSKTTKIIGGLLAINIYLIYVKHSNVLGNELLAYLDDSEHPLQNFFNLHVAIAAFIFVCYKTATFKLPRRRYCIVDTKYGRIIRFTKPYSEQSNSSLLQSAVVQNLLFYLERRKICRPFFKDYTREESEYKEEFKGTTFASHENDPSR